MEVTFPIALQEYPLTRRQTYNCVTRGCLQAGGERWGVELREYIVIDLEIQVRGAAMLNSS